MKNILFIATGGTIASKDSGDGLKPQISPSELLSAVPEIIELCTVSTVQLFNLDSTNICYSHWLKIAKCIEENYNAYDGFVIAHGTDTMAYSAAALSYLIQNNKKPIVLTGAQRSIGLRETDARINLLDAFVYATHEKSCGVHIVFNRKVIMGTRARKNRTKSFDAFSSVDYPEVAIIQDKKILYFIEEKILSEKPTFYHNLNPKIFVLKLIPGLEHEVFTHLKEYYDAVVIESFGVGGIPCYVDESFVDAISDWLNSNKTMIMTTQVPHEGSDIGMYQVGRQIKNQYEVLEAHRMTLEAVVTKIMWILGQTKDKQKIKELFYSPIQNDIMMWR